MHAVLYINDSSKWPIQVLLRQVVIVSSGMNADATAVDVVPPAQSVKMAVIAVATLPMLAIYPFVQRFFVKGAMIGSVKG
jgi:putative aldouronate transport system permease protein